MITLKNIKVSYCLVLQILYKKKEYFLLTKLEAVDHHTSCVFKIRLPHMAKIDSALKYIKCQCHIYDIRPFCIIFPHLVLLI